MNESLKSAYKQWLGNTVVDTVVRKTYARFFGNDVLRVLYYRQMHQIFDRVLKADSNCIDIGCHEGNVLEEILLHAPNGTHFAYEPIPSRFTELQHRFPQVHVQGIALSDREGETTFHYVKDCDALSGLKRREYPGGTAQSEEIAIRTAPLDRTLPPTLSITLIKIDVEGAELPVLRGAERTLKTYRPYTIFQHGMGSAEFYDTTPEHIFDLFARCGMKISLMEDWLHGRPALPRPGFSKQFYKRLNYIFLAHPA